MKAVRSLPKGSNSVPVLLDSGVRRGTDVLKALALGGSIFFLRRNPEPTCGQEEDGKIERGLERVAVDSCLL